jgi:hypothetical protein
MRSRTIAIVFIHALVLCASASAKEGLVDVPDLSYFSFERPLVLVGGIGQEARYVIVQGRKVIFPLDWIVARFRRPGDILGEVVYDRSSGAFYGFMNGALVKFEDGKAIVLQEEVRGQDLDVHAKRGLYVVRQEDSSIVLFSLPSGKRLRVLARSEMLFRPRFSPDGDKVLISESRPDHGHFWVFSLEGQGRAMGEGYFPVWLGDSRRVLFCMVKNDSYQITDSDLFVVDTKTLERKRLTFTPDIHEIMPSASDDDSFVVFSDAKTGRLMSAPLDIEGLR